MESNKETKKVLSKSDITKVGLRCTLLQSMFNYERMQSGGWLISMLPELKKIYKDDKDGLREAMKDNLNFINTSPPLAGMLMGMLLSLEEAKAERETISGLRVALFGPIAGIGDSLFWFTLLPIVAGISASFAQEGNILGPLIFFLVYLGMFLVKIPFTHLGYNAGYKAVDTIAENAKKIAHAATILGVTVVGALIANYVNITLLPEITMGEGNVVNIQKDLIDTIFPKLLPFLYTILMYYLMKFKKVKSTTLIIITFLGVMVLSYLGIL
ncbi:PTS system, mannose/fructose/sorbose family, IID component [Helcococcus kunzii ATCC 51366]|uniref:PTS system, mannose/fructose/sorbose family, IID component n=1 Tax=Helcococcus kunzii ATCC 51366 TaxID=883114 RepID=H3NQ56_9FIRM|nr:PTS galactosamine transporter subunit IID [Helcococcus kunzii]EHR32536.1 PTS system, mannose/fructose/sorbose family, IID component [Helcococcus kunzii ATCC 51366]MCT1796367.1 PTS galactosamine transporter subunit IID [Helcococcus kunzii]MCT1989417.1 PTS galactosamine transporter subunit IID [Helcococcus kunzii]